MILQAYGIRKVFGATQALDGADFDLRRGEVHALLGANGAGKSTLVKILAGVYRPDAGRLLLERLELGRMGPAQARAAGIETMYQDTALVPGLSVVENIALGRHDATWGLVDWPGLRRRGAEALARLELNVPPDRPVGELPIAEQRAVELARALARRCRVLILDEPTATLGASEASRLIERVRLAASGGVGVIYVSHHLDEVLEVADRATVLRDGRCVAVRNLRDHSVTSRDLVRDMVGRDVDVAAAPGGSRGEAVLRLDAVGVPGELEGVSLELHRGEVLGAFGAVGAGQTTLARVVTGQSRARAGELLMKGERVRVRSPRDALRRGIALVPEDRLRNGLVPAFDVAESIELSRRALRRPLVARRNVQHAKEWIRRLDIRPADPRACVATLSGGNQQKVVFAKALSSESDVVVLDEPTAGVDVGAKEEIRALIGSLAADGTAVLVVSSDPDEVLAVCHRILVLRKGRVIASIDRATAGAKDLLELATGANG